MHHIGSTCVPGHTAKPIIDLTPLVTRCQISTGNVGAMRHVTLPSEMTCAGILTWRLLTPLKSAAPRHLQLSDSHAYSDEKAAWIRDTVTKALVWLNGQQTAIHARPPLD